MEHTNLFRFLKRTLSLRTPFVIGRWNQGGLAHLVPPLSGAALRIGSFIILQIVKTFIWATLSESQDFESLEFEEY